MGNWHLEVTEKALKDLERVPPKDRERIKSGIERLAFEGSVDLQRLRGEGGEWRLRVGRWRVRFERDRNERVLRILRVLPRPDAYK